MFCIQIAPKIESSIPISTDPIVDEYVGVGAPVQSSWCHHFDGSLRQPYKNRLKNISSNVWKVDSL